MGKRILITGGSHAELPLIKAAQERGDYVITTGNDSQGLGHQAADEYVCGDYSDKEYVYQLAKEKQVDAIVSGCNDFAYLSTAYACEKLGLPGHDSYKTALVIHHKDQFRTCTKQLGIATPRNRICKNLEDVREACQQLCFPVLVKPVDLTGGKGVAVCTSEEEVQKAYGVAGTVTRESEVVIEEYIQGSNHGASVLLKNQQVVFGFIDNEQYYHNPYLVSGACYPSDVKREVSDRLYRDIEKVVHALKLTDGLFHVQFIVGADGTPVMIDPCRRSPGDLYILLVKYATGVDYPLAILRAECGEPVAEAYIQNPANIARECLMADKNGVVTDIEIRQELQARVIDRCIWGNIGDTIEDYMKYKAGILFIREPQVQQLYEDVQNFHKLAVVHVQQDDSKIRTEKLKRGECVT